MNMPLIVIVTHFECTTGQTLAKNVPDTQTNYYTYERNKKSKRGGDAVQKIITNRAASFLENFSLIWGSKGENITAKG